MAIVLKLNNRFFIYLIVAIAAGSTFASDIYLPSFPALAKAFNTNQTNIQLSLTIYLLGFSLFQLLWGPLSDRFGRRKNIILGISICVIGSIFCAVSNKLLLFFIGRFLQGVGAAACMSLVRTMARDAFEKEQLSKVFSLMGMIFAVSFAIAPAVGGYLQTGWGWQASFIFVMIYMLIMLIIAIVMLPETNKSLNPSATKLSIFSKNVATLFSSRVFMGYSVCYGLTWSGLIAYASLSPFLFQNVLHLSVIAYGHLAIAITIGLIVASFINSSLVIKLGSKKMMTLGLSYMVLASLVMFAIGLFGIVNVLAIMIPMIFFVIGIGIVSANAGAGALSLFGNIAGVAGAIYGFLQIFITFIISTGVAHLPTNSQQTLAGTLIILALGAAGFYYLIAIKQPKSIKIIDP